MPVTTMLLPSPRREKSEECDAPSTNACSSISITTVSQGDDDSDQHYRKESDKDDDTTPRRETSLKHKTRAPAV